MSAGIQNLQADGCVFSLNASVVFSFMSLMMLKGDVVPLGLVVVDIFSSV